MLGCIARAASDAVCPDTTEIEECKWFSREELAAALARSASPESPYLGGKGGDAALFVPAKTAIAHHLRRLWVERGAPWFGGPQARI